MTEIKHYNTLTDFESYGTPYNYTKEDIKNLPDPTTSEASLWVLGKRKQAINTYKNRTKVSDTKLVLWLFFVCSKIAHHVINDFNQIIKDKLPENPIE
jgi:hypothetical protein